MDNVQVKAELAWGAPAGAERRARRPDGNKPSPAKRVQPSSYAKPAAPKRPQPTGVHYVPDEDSGMQMQFGAATAGATEGAGVGADMTAADDVLAVGRWVAHPTWGRGQIIGREGSGNDTKLSIRFGRTTKRVVAAYAQLQPA